MTHDRRDFPPAPDYRLAIDVDGDILRVRVSGDIDAQPVRMAYWREIIETARARECRKLLVADRRKGRPATPDELAELAMAMQHWRDDFDRVAVIEPIAAFVPAIEHAEILGQAVGINVRIFADPTEAERWVRFGSADD